MGKKQPFLLLFTIILVATIVIVVSRKNIPNLITKAIENDDSALLTPTPRLGQDTINLFGTDSLVKLGVARHEYYGFTFAHIISTNLPPPKPGKFYQGWLVMPDKTDKPISLGKLVSTGHGFANIFTSNNDYTAYTQVLVSEETEDDGLDNTMEHVVMSGNYDEASRQSFFDWVTSQSKLFFSNLQNK